ncbi:hypothetical protein ACJ73_06893 [Blastomyces percursus]|uniref:Uncharacterized protein n=1 Tax=Blastomyces percursus TaxID=1658174 RepID=A0A1J9QZX0_9EURO|nr:hypothetical protein ACJ73_06893 [Blastomyces percursus]
MPQSLLTPNSTCLLTNKSLNLGSGQSMSASTGGMRPHSSPSPRDAATCQARDYGIENRHDTADDGGDYGPDCADNGH